MFNKDEKFQVVRVLLNFHTSVENSLTNNTEILIFSLNSFTKKSDTLTMISINPVYSNYIRAVKNVIRKSNYKRVKWNAKKSSNW